MRFESGPESVFRSVLIQYASGNLLESFEYNALCCLTELLTDSKQNREGFSAYHGECLKVQGNTVLVVVGGRFNGKYPALTYASLGANHHLHSSKE